MKPITSLRKIDSREKISSHLFTKFYDRMDNYPLSLGILLQIGISIFLHKMFLSGRNYIRVEGFFNKSTLI